jgi:hypothetical protein
MSTTVFICTPPRVLRACPLNLSAFFYDLDVSDVIPAALASGRLHLRRRRDGADLCDGAEVGNATGWTEVDTRPGAARTARAFRSARILWIPRTALGPAMSMISGVRACLDEPPSSHRACRGRHGRVSGRPGPRPVLHFDLNGGTRPIFGARPFRRGLLVWRNCSYTFPGGLQRGYTLYGWKTSSDGVGFYVGPWDWYRRRRCDAVRHFHGKQRRES